MELTSRRREMVEEQIGSTHVVIERYVTRYAFFFFSSRRRHTRYWRDWSSDVCSSDLSSSTCQLPRRGRPSVRAASIETCLFRSARLRRPLREMCAPALPAQSANKPRGVDRKSVV